jgi:hypothetical protein
VVSGLSQDSCECCYVLGITNNTFNFYVPEIYILILDPCRVSKLKINEFVVFGMRLWFVVVSPIPHLIRA